MLMFVFSFWAILEILSLVWSFFVRLENQATTTEIRRDNVKSKKLVFKKKYLCICITPTLYCPQNNVAQVFHLITNLQPKQISFNNGHKLVDPLQQHPYNSPVESKKWTLLAQKPISYDPLIDLVVGTPETRGGRSRWNQPMRRSWRWLHLARKIMRNFSSALWYYNLLYNPFQQTGPGFS